ncbi:MAG TPA: asparagine synthase-related protein [Terriglobales bacterium]|nr:asparagine synthase-related protein [Terriglobales bacterium]
MSAETLRAASQQVETVYGNREAFFRLTKVDGRWVSTGTPHCVLSQNPLARDTSAFDGVFAEWLWDGAELIARNDRYGFMPMYYYQAGNEFCISGSIPTLLRQGTPAEFDYVALSVFLRLGYYIGEDTAFRAIRMLPPSARLNWKNGRLSITGSIPMPTPISMTRDEAMEAFIPAVRDAIKRTHPKSGEFVVTLSGGRDSRHIFLELLECGFQPSACVSVCNYEPWSSGDVEIAAELCKATGVRHELVQQRSSPFLADLHKNLQTSLSVLEHAWIIALEMYLKGRTQVVYEGVACDMYTTGYSTTTERLALIRNHQFSELSDDLLDKDEPLRLRLLGRSRYQLANRQVAIERLAQELGKHAEAASPLVSFFLYSRTRRVTALAPFNMLTEVGHVVTPYLDPALYDLLCALPAEIFLDHNFHTDSITKAYPKYAHIPYAAKKLSAAPKYKFFANLALQLGAFSLEPTKHQLLSRSYLWPRLLRCLVDKPYTPALGWLGDIATYLMHLEHAADGKVLDVSEIH